MPTKKVWSWTAMVQGYVHGWMLREAREMFDLIPTRNAWSWMVMVQVYTRDGMLREAREIDVTSKLTK
jgi:hypothetical protein